MKLLAIFIAQKENDRKVKILQNEFKLDHLGYFERQSVRPFLVLSARTAVERTDINLRQSIEIDEKINATVHVYVRLDGLASVVISNNEYPKRVAHSLMSKVMEDFTKTHPSTCWEKMIEGSGKMTSLNEMLVEYQNPEEADALMRLQKDLDETKEIMVSNLEKLLDRGEKLDDLVARSNDLNFQAKAFYITARKTNRCCNLF